MFDLSPVELLIVGTFVLVGTLVQSSVGIGLGLVIVPVLAVIAPWSLPAVPLLLAVPLTVLMVARERADVDIRGLAPMLSGRLLGTGIAVWLLVLLSESALEILFGLVILAVVAISLGGPEIRPTMSNRVLAGTASGLFSTTAAVGGPPLALLYQRRPGPQLRSTLSLVFLLGTLLSLAGLMVAGRLGTTHLLLTLVLGVPMMLGFLASRPIARFLDRGWLRPAVLAFATAGAVAAIVRGLWG